MARVRRIAGASGGFDAWRATGGASASAGAGAMLASGLGDAILIDVRDDPV